MKDGDAVTDGQTDLSAKERHELKTLAMQKSHPASLLLKTLWWEPPALWIKPKFIPQPRRPVARASAPGPSASPCVLLIPLFLQCAHLKAWIQEGEPRQCASVLCGCSPCVRLRPCISDILSLLVAGAQPSASVSVTSFQTLSPLHWLHTAHWRALLVECWSCYFSSAALSSCSWRKEEPWTSSGGCGREGARGTHSVCRVVSFTGVWHCSRSHRFQQPHSFSYKTTFCHSVNEY